MTLDAPLATPAARHARARILDLARAGVASPDFLYELSRQLQRIIPFAGSFWSAADPLTTLATSPARVENLGSQCARWWEREFLVPDFNLFRDLLRAERPAASLYRATGGQPMRSVRHRELHREAGYGDELRGVFRSGTTAWGYVSLWRHADDRPFSAAEEKLVADLSAPIAEAFRRAALLAAAAAADAPAAPGLLVFDRQGNLVSFNDQAEAWLREIPGSGSDDQIGFSVPIPTGIRTIYALTHAIEDGVELGAARAHLRGTSGRWLTIHGFPLREPQDAASKTAIVIEPAKAAELAPIIVEAFDLSPREQQITQMVARGLSTAEIAQRLSLSQHTVRDYVKSIFDKVGVSSRGELVARIFADHYAEPLTTTAIHASTLESGADALP
ncbi:MAG TPA: LuxR C-terminal-related transcriptional regulator [Vicinamibacterales bacterium]|nr:LuxR C-terminal-related transcriptional regulator [Vicinamibacterales bacterium]